MSKSTVRRPLFHEILAKIFTGQVPTEGMEMVFAEPQRANDVVIGDINDQPLIKGLYIEMGTRIQAFNTLAGILNGKKLSLGKPPTAEEIELDALNKEIDAINNVITFCLMFLFPKAEGKKCIIRVGWKVVEEVAKLCPFCDEVHDWEADKADRSEGLHSLISDLLRNVTFVHVSRPEKG